jgi:hypothetical protein
MFGDDRGQRRLLQAKPMVHAVSAASERRAADTTVK